LLIFFVHSTGILCRIGTKHEILVQKSHENPLEKNLSIVISFIVCIGTNAHKKVKGLLPLASLNKCLHDLAKEQKVASMVVECINCEYYCYKGNANLPFDAELSDIKISLRMENKLHHMLRLDVMYYGGWFRYLHWIMMEVGSPEGRYHGTKIINDVSGFKGYVGLVVVFLLNASLPLGPSGRHASRHTIINLMGGSNNYCSY
jgi:hypothetical protein